MDRYDGVALTSGWALHSANGNLDSLRSLRERNPELVVLLVISTGYSCSNWGSNELIGKQEWGQTLAENGDRWILRDTDGDRWILKGEASCAEGRLNFGSVDMARAYAHFIAESMVAPHGDLIDGFDIDELYESVWWWNKSYRAPLADNVDSLDLDQDGIADTKEQVDQSWAAGVDTFLTTFRRLIGNRYIMVNGVPPESAYPLINGRFHQAFPAEEGRGWEFGMSDPVYGALVANELHSRSPGSMNLLQADNCSFPNQFDPLRLSTKEAPADHPGLDKQVRFTLGSALLSGSMYTMSGWGTAVDWKDDPIPRLYQTLWWFPIYDTLRTHLGLPEGEYTRGLSQQGEDLLERKFSGGKVRVYPDLGKGIFDLRPSVEAYAFDDPVPIGDKLPIRWSAFDPNGAEQELEVTIDLSRNGGESFPERIGAAGGSDSLFLWETSGDWPYSCLVRITATDTTGLTDTAYAPLYLVAPAAAVSGGSAEIQPSFWIVNTPAVACSVTVKPELNDSSVAGWKEAHIVLPDPTALAQFRGVQWDGLPRAASFAQSGDTVRVSLDTHLASSAPVMILLDLVAPAETPEDSLRFKTGLRSDTPGEPITWLEGGDANRFAGDGGNLAVAAGTGPAVTLTVDPEDLVITAGNTFLFSADLRDVQANPIDAPFEWSVTDSIGTIDSLGLFTANGGGSGTVRAGAGGLFDSATVEVLDTLLKAILLPEEPLLSADSVLQFDLFGITLLGDTVRLAAAWSLENLDGTLDDSGLYTPHLAGSGVVIAAGAFADSTTVTVAPGAPADLAIAGAVVMVAGDAHPVASTLADQWGNIAAGTVLYRSSGPCNGPFIPPFLCTTAGSDTIVAHFETLSDTLFVEVNHAEPSIISISPSPVSLPVDSIFIFNIESFDPYGNVIDSGWTFSAYGGIGNVEQDGRFTATAPGSGGVIAAIASAADTALLTVTPIESPPPVVALALHVPEGGYVASGWPAPWLLVVEAVDSLGLPAAPAGSGSLTVSINPVDGTLPSPPIADIIVAGGAFPESLLVPMEMLGGCGDLAIEAFTADGLVAPPETLPFSTPDVDGSFEIDLLDVAALLEQIDSPGSPPMCDLNGNSLLDSADIEVVVSRLEGTGEGSAPGEGAPRWIHAGTNPGICPGESLASRFLLYAEALDSIRALHLSFDLPAAATGVTWQQSDGWTSSYVGEVKSDLSTSEWLIVNNGIFETEGGPIAEITICGVGENDWSLRGANLTAINADYEIVPTLSLEIEFELAVEDTSGAPDTTSSSDSEAIPPAFTLSPCSPNPFRDRTVIRYGLPRSAEKIAYSVFTLNGRLVANHSDLPRSAGFHAVEWDGRDQRGNDTAPGTYFIRLTTPAGSLTRKLTLIR